MITALTVIHAIVALLLIIMVLLHFGKGAEAGLLLDTGSSSIIPSQGNILNKITTVLAIIFLGSSLALASLRSRMDESSIFDNAKVPVTKTLPAPAPAAAAPTEAPAASEPAPAPAPKSTN